MFLNFFCMDDPKDVKGLEQNGVDMIKEAFSICPEIDFIIYLCPKVAQTSMFMDTHFYRIDRPEDENNHFNGLFEEHKLFYAHRSRFLSRLSVREAITEDNDELIPILEAFDPELLGMQGSFFVADLIDKQTDIDKVFVGLNGNIVVGMLATTLDVNVKELAKCFDIESLENMLIKEPEKPLPPPLVISVQGDIRLVDVAAIAKTLENRNSVFINMETGETVFYTDELVVEIDKVLEEKEQDRRADSKGGEEETTPVIFEAKDSEAALKAESKEDTKQNYAKLEGKGHVKGQGDVLNEFKGADSKSQGKPAAQKHAQVAYSRVPKTLREIVDGACPPGGQSQPVAVVLFGYVKREVNDETTSGELAVDDHHRYFPDEFFSAVDFVLEIGHSNEDYDADESDEYLHHCMMTVELLRDEIEGDCQWLKIADANDVDLAVNTEPVILAILDILNRRESEIARSRSIEHSEPKVNALAVTLFSMEAGFVSRSEDLLKLAFETHPTIEYCLYELPNDRPTSKLTRTFKHVHLLPGKSSSNVLYVVHRQSFLAKEYMRVKRMLPDFMPALQTFVADLPAEQQESIAVGARKAMKQNDVDLADNPSEVCLVVTLHETVVGIVQLSQQILTAQDSDWICANYKVADVINIDRHKPRSQAAVVQFVLNPIYSKWSLFILRETMRMYDKTVLFYNASLETPPPREVLEEFIHLCPRRRMQQPNDNSIMLPLVERPSASEGGLGNNSPMFCISKRNLSRPKDSVFKRIAVVAGSPHSYAFLEAVCFMPTLNFPNLYVVVDKPPAPFRLEDSEDSKTDDDFNGYFTKKAVEFPTLQELSAMGLINKVTIVAGNMTDIDRENQAIIVNDELVLEYDLLVISSHVQDNSSMSYPAICKLHPSSCVDAGIFGLGNPSADLLALKWVKKRSSKPEPIVVNGNYVDTMTAVARLLALGIEPKKVVAVVKDEPLNIEEVLDKVAIEKLVSGAKASAVRIYWGHVINDVHLNRNGFVQSVVVRSKKEIMTNAGGVGGDAETKSADAPRDTIIPCTGLLLCNTRQCSRDVFMAVNDSGLVYDGGMVVDDSFRTVDPAIYAVSDYTRFSTVFSGSSIPHARYNPRELGLFVALKVFERHLNPLSTTFRAGRKTANFFSRGASICKFKLPRSFTSELPGRVQYFRSCVPDPSPDLLLFPTSCTHQVNSKNVSRLVMMKLGDFGVVSELFYLGEEKVEPRNLSLIPGTHESYLNGAVFTYEKGLVEDWVQFFRASWACIVFHDKFPMLVQAHRSALNTDVGFLKIMDQVLSQAENIGLENQEDIAKYRRELTGPFCERLEKATKETVSTETATFLQQNRPTLNSYLHGQK